MAKISGINESERKRNINENENIEMKKIEAYEEMVKMAENSMRRKPSICERMAKRNVAK
jgi:DNA polymerase III delta prime subunit